MLACPLTRCIPSEEVTVGAADGGKVRVWTGRIWVLSHDRMGGVRSWGVVPYSRRHLLGGWCFSSRSGIGLLAGGLSQLGLDDLKGEYLEFGD
jgi:hypothetical protein